MIRTQISKNILHRTLALLLMCGVMYSHEAKAVPAKPGVATVTQADGSKLRIMVKGDEFFNWRTTESGDPITLGDDGYYYFADYQANGEFKASSQRVSVGGIMQSPRNSSARNQIVQIARNVADRRRSQRSEAATRSTSSGGFPSKGKIRSAVIIVEYSDVKFSVDNPKQAFHNQLNQEGYSVAGATGSARDYFSINSRGQFDGQFDVYGPYTLSQPRKYYGGNDDNGHDLRPDKMIWDAVALADADGVDFSQYDYDEDGYIDNIFVYYAGHNEAEWGSEDSVWPHKWVVGSKPVFDGKKLFVYACTSELRGDKGATIAGIGTFCHEFSHVFGLADHYDTDGSNNGSSNGLGTYDIMTSGSYNNNGNTPPLHNGLELEMIGWNTPTVLDASQDITIEPIQRGEVYKMLTDIDDEYFLIENRQQKSNVWDQHIAASGLFITHIDRSTRHISKWSANGPNNDTRHECFKFIVAGNVPFNSSPEREAMVPYPYKGNNVFGATSSPAARSWTDNTLEFDIKEITQNSDGTMSFSVDYSGAQSSILTVECNRTQIFVNDKFTLEATIKDPYVRQGDLKWTVTDKDNITETEVDDKILSGRFSAEGSATFTATYTSLTGKVAVIKTELKAKALQGATGCLLDATTQAPIANATLSFYPVTRSSSAQYTTTTDDEGIYTMELAQGSSYEVAIEVAGYTSLFEMVKIEEGSNNYDFAMDSYASTIDGLSIEASQSKATLVWDPQDHALFDVRIKNGDTTVNTASIEDDSKHSVEGLSPATTYDVIISSYSEKLYTSQFTTMSKTTYIPLIHLEAYNYKDGEVISLNMLNTEASDTVSWYYDNALLQTDKVTLDSGEHTIKAVVVRDGETYNVIKKISVK